MAKKLNRNDLKKTSGGKVECILHPLYGDVCCARDEKNLAIPNQRHTKDELEVAIAPLPLIVDIDIIKI